MDANKICPSCDEENPAEAAMCWACYTPLNTSGEVPHFYSMKEERRRREREARLNSFKAQVEPWLKSGLWLGAIASGIVSGDQPRRRGALIASGVACHGSLGAWGLWERHVDEQNRQRSEADETPVRRIANTLLLYAVRDGASQIRLRAGIGIQVCYLIKGEWLEQMKIPAYVWDDLRTLWKSESQNWQGPVRFAYDGRTIEFAPRIAQDYPLQVLTLTLAA